MNAPAATVIHSARLVTHRGETADAWVRFEDDRVAATGTGDGWRAQPADEVVDASGRILTPGFIDLHCHGAGGFAFDIAEDHAIEAALAVHRRHGTTRSVLSLVTAALPDLTSRLEAIARVAKNDPLVLGSHAEGPFIDDEFRGAHDPRLLIRADAEAIEAVLEAADGTLRQLTIAPEHPGALEAIERLTAQGVRAAVGHTGADLETARTAFDRGASILTHAFNGMRGIHHRAPGPVIAAISSDHVTLEVINDGVHVHPEVVSMAFSSAPGRIALITDAMAAAGAADGDYILGSLAVVVRHGVARLKDGDAIAGSTLLLDEALRRAVEAGIPLPDAVGALTIVPARTLGLDDELGTLEPGYAADAVLLDVELRPESVWAAGEKLR
ncbi:N-acetylglucosamine-6-phosphate deacetylase [Microbacterium sp. MEC084]|uniref:N-acetylglucosamine-6-phosphate deacetylase n=1 Tax=Microbacterium sp. MEC084 TaxID=1963027 RepID=UPI00106FF804|nr:N-acetylglucosamine-6-phosphate deacetylase [Microbacterium sp. MEC084]MCD1267681.1 N-acetylglucosamine-6-phosphate deacetylase [Microbacterium sp. MEC084]